MNRNDFNLQWVVDGLLARSCRPAYAEENPSLNTIIKWLAEAQAMGIKSILCLLSEEELTDYYGRLGIPLLDCYRRAGFVVGPVPVPDYADPPLTVTESARILALFQQLPRPCIIHCSAGIDRTGAAVQLILKAREAGN